MPARSAQQKNPTPSPSSPDGYLPSHPQALIAFFSGPRTSEATSRETKATRKGGEQSRVTNEYRTIPQPFPTFEDFAASLGLEWEGVVRVWAKTHPEFLKALSRAREMQRAWLIDIAARGFCPGPTFTALMRLIHEPIQPPATAEPEPSHANGGVPEKPTRFEFTLDTPGIANGRSREETADRL